MKFPFRIEKWIVLSSQCLPGIGTEKQEIVSILRKLVQTPFEDTLFGLIPSAFNIFIFHNIKSLLPYVYKGSGVQKRTGLISHADKKRFT